MRKTTTSYIIQINIQSIRNFILDNQVTEKDTLLLNQVDYDKLALEYRETYNATLPAPYILLGVLVEEDAEGIVKDGSVVVVKDDRLSYYYPSGDEFSEADEVIYRCGWCGNVVDYDGAELAPNTRSHKISMLEKYRYKIYEKQVHGACCPNRVQ